MQTGKKVLVMNLEHYQFYFFGGVLLVFQILLLFSH